MVEDHRFQFQQPQLSRLNDICFDAHSLKDSSQSVFLTKQFLFHMLVLWHHLSLHIRYNRDYPTLNKLHLWL